LASSEYNRRREECSEGVEIIKRSYPDVSHLRDVSVEMLQKCKDKMDPMIYRRCKYVVEENARVLNACIELELGNLKAFGAYMNRTHNGLSRDYEVSCAELDYLVELVKDSPYVYGARMMGGGFGGCTINLIEHQAVEEVSQLVAGKYKQEFHIDLKSYITSIDSGTHIITANEYAAD
jgi:galactokinase